MELMTATTKVRPEETRAIVRRLKLLRATTGLSQADFAATIGLAPQNWGNFEAGSRISLDAALAVVRAYGVTLDWIYLGHPYRMPAELMDQIRDLEARLDESALQTRKRPRRVSSS